MFYFEVKIFVKTKLSQSNFIILSLLTNAYESKMTQEGKKIVLVHFLNSKVLLIMSKLGHNVPANCVVTGGSGFVGQRLVEMLVERGAKRVVSFDVLPTPKGASERPEVWYCGENNFNIGIDEILYFLFPRLSMCKEI